MTMYLLVLVYPVEIRQRPINSTTAIMISAAAEDAPAMLAEGQKDRMLYNQTHMVAVTRKSAGIDVSTICQIAAVVPIDS